MFSLTYYFFKLIIWMVKISWKMVILLTFLQGLYNCVMKIHQACKYFANWEKKKDDKKVIVKMKSDTSFEDDIRPEDSVSVVSAFSSQDSEESVFGNIDSFQESSDEDFIEASKD
eukprot:GFUD01132392.1.p1 GENE.GFUD01132392.1~~GFUD01132392.1.p1  ORF type:complete len:128 (-),score=29.62 GFUD01132392.1:6-350(-)